MELCCIERQAIVANNHSEPGKIKGKWKRFFHLSELSKDFSACMHFFQMQIVIILSIADLILWKHKYMKNQKKNEFSFSKKSFLVKRQVILAVYLLNLLLISMRNPANSLLVNFLVVSLFSQSEDVSLSRYVPHCLHCLLTTQSRGWVLWLWCCSASAGQRHCNAPWSVSASFLSGRHIKLVWLCEQGFFKKY